MAEAVGLAVSVAALAGLFNNTVDCFEFVQLGRNFGKDYDTSQVMLDNAQLRLSRWGKSLGLGDNIRDVESLATRFQPLSNVTHAERLLGQVFNLFADAEGVSHKYKIQNKSDSNSLAIYNPQTDLSSEMASLHEKMRGLSIKRQNNSGLRQKTKWALYEGEHFRQLIGNITKLVDDLVDLFPASKQSQRELCDAEVSVLGSGEAITVLQEIAASQDKLLEQAINAQARDSTFAKSHHIEFSGNGNSGAQVGHNSGTMSGFTFGKGN